MRKAGKRLETDIRENNEIQKRNARAHEILVSVRDNLFSLERDCSPHSPLRQIQTRIFNIRHPIDRLLFPEPQRLQAPPDWESQPEKDQETVPPSKPKVFKAPKPPPSTKPNSFDL